jgi:hypothetical protein
MNVNHARSMKFAGRRRRLEYISWDERTPALGARYETTCDFGVGEG